MKAKKGFTLAETLISIAVLGIIAAITVPSLMSTTNKHAYVNGLKRANLMLKTATSQLMAGNSGTMIGIIPDDSYDDIRDKYCGVLNCIKKCSPGTSGCFVPTAYTLSGLNITSTAFNFNSGYSTALLSNGMSISFGYYRKACNQSDDMNSVGSGTNLCDDLYIDINGYKSPNKVGRDIFRFMIYQQGIMPSGINGLKLDGGDDNWVKSCNPTVAASGYPGIYSGLNCTGRILTEGAMNY